MPRARLQFSLRFLLIVMTAVAVACTFAVHYQALGLLLLCMALYVLTGRFLVRNVEPIYPTRIAVRPERPRFQFRLRTLFIVMTLAAIVLSWAFRRDYEEELQRRITDANQVEWILKLRPNLARNWRYPATPLHAAVAAHALQSVQVLLQHDADPNATDDNEATPLHYAAGDGPTTMPPPQPVIVEALLAAGASPNRTNQCGQTPLHIAAIWRDSPTIELLLKHGADPNVQDNAGVAPLRFAALSDPNPQIQRLLQMHRQKQASPANTKEPPNKD